MLKKIFLLVSIFAFGCSHQQLDEKFQTPLEKQNCDEAFKNIPELQPQEKWVQGSQFIARNAAAYTYIAANYTAEVIWDTSTGVILYTGLCLPFAILSAKSQSRGASQPMPFLCAGGAHLVHKKVRSPPLGRNSIAQTQQFRCPNIKPLADSLMKVVSCYEKKGDKESLDKALTNLINLEKSEHFYECLEADQQMLIKDKQVVLQKQLDSLYGL